MINKKIVIAASGLLLLAAYVSKAQQSLPPDNNFYDMDRIRVKTAWLESRNAAGLGLNNTDMSVINAFYNNENGSYRDVWDGKTNHMFGVNTESYKKYGKVSFYGKLGYDYLTENQKSWSGLMYPWSTPMLIADEVQGQTRRERYMVAAGMSVPLGRKFAFGIAGDYLVASNAKRRDARNLNDYMSLSITPGFMFKSCPMNIGISATYGRQTQKLEYTTYGSMVAPNIYSFDGLWFYTAVPYTSSFLQRRFVDDVYGGALQLDFRLGADARFFNEFSMDYREQSQLLYRSSTEKYGDFDKITYSYSGAFIIEGVKTDHNIRLKASLFDLFKYSNVQGFEYVDGATKTVVQMGRIRNYSERHYDMGAEYRLFIKRTDWNSSWIVGAGFEYSKKENVYYIYPATFNQTIENARFYGSVNKNFLLKRGMLDVTLAGGVVTGKGEMNDIVTPAGTTIPGGALAQKTDLLEWNYNYQAVDRAYGKGTVRYTHFLNPAKGMGIFAELSGSYVKTARNAAFPRAERTFVQLAAGLNF